MNRNMLSIAIPSVILLVLATAAALLVGRATASRPADGQGILVQAPVDLPDVQLTDHHNRTGALVSEIVGDDLLVVTFNYTTCQSICGVGNAIMQEVDRVVGAGSGRPVRLLSITINPTVDTPDKLAEAAAAYEPSERWLWTTGRPADIEDILRQSGAQVADIELHQLVFIVGDGRRKTFHRVPAIDAGAGDIVAALKELGS